MRNFTLSILFSIIAICNTSIVSARSQADTIEVWKLLQKSQDYYQVNMDSVIEFIKPALKIAEELKFTKGIVECKRLIGKNYLINEDYNTATQYYLEALKIAESEKNKTQIADLNVSLGRVYQTLEDFPKTLDYYKNALDIYTSINDEFGIAKSLSSIGNAHHSREYCENRTSEQKIVDFNRAIEFYKKSSGYFAAIKDVEGVAGTYINIGTVLNKLSKPKEALVYMSKAETIFDSLGYKDALSSIYFEQGRIYKNLLMHRKSLESYKKCIAVASEIGKTGGIQYIYEAMAQAYDSLKDYKNAKDYYMKYMILRDSIYNAEKSQQLFNLEAKYQAEKREKEIVILNQEKAEAQTKLTKRRNLVYFMSLFVLIIAAFAIYAYRNFRLKRNLGYQLKEQNEEILEKNSELNAQKEQLEIYNSKLENQKEEILAQRDLINKKNNDLSIALNQIELKNRDITSSIKYAKRIQNSYLPSNKIFKQLFPQSFVFYKPKDIVSGDFYWTFESKDYRIIAVSDCTGHGVPGAFMSFVGINLLNQAVKEQKVFKAGEILNSINNRLIDNIHNPNKAERVRDGMEIGVCVFKKATNSFSFAGAGIDLLIFSSNEFKLIKADKHSIGYQFYDEFLQYSEMEINYNANDCIYLFSDGFVDQFGGKSNRKYGRKRFREYLSSINSKPMDVQKGLLEKELGDWQRETEQIDDIIVVGLKL